MYSDTLIMQITKQKKLRRKALSLFLLISLSSFAPLASAGLVGIYELTSKNRQMTLEYLDEENIKIQIEEEFYLLVKGTKMYMINGNNVTDVKAFREQVEGWRITKFLQNRAQKRLQKMPTNGKLTMTDKTETLAGIKGTVWEARIIDPDNQREEVKEIVITDDARVVALKLAMQNVSRAQETENTPEDFKKMRAAMESTFGNDVAILRYDDRFKLKSIQEAHLDPEKFLLPADQKIRTMPSISDLGNILQLVASLSAD